MADNAQKLYILLLGACAYTILTIATTPDSKLITNSATAPLPIIQTPVPIAGFYWVAPVILAMMYFYFHLYLQRLWDALADLPAVFPDGISVANKVDPWLVIGLIRRYVPRLASEHPTFSMLHTLVVVPSAWWAVPLTLSLLWGRYLRRHEWGGTTLHVFLLGAGVAGAVLFHSVAKATFARSGRSQMLRSPWRWSCAIVLVAVPVGVLSLGAIEGLSRNPAFGSPRTWVPHAMKRLLGYSVFANLDDAEVSVKPAWWIDRSEQIEL